MQWKSLVIEFVYSCVWWGQFGAKCNKLKFNRMKVSEFELHWEMSEKFAILAIRLLSIAIACAISSISSCILLGLSSVLNSQRSFLRNLKLQKTAFRSMPWAHCCFLFCFRLASRTLELAQRATGSSNELLVATEQTFLLPFRRVCCLQARIHA
jgi:hypothetical protein